VGPAVATEPAELDIVAVGFSADPEDADQLVLRTVEGAPPSVGLVPHDQVEHRARQFAVDHDQLFDVAPVHADIVNRALRSAISVIVIADALALLRSTRRRP